MRDKMQYKIVVKKNLAVARKICMKKVIFIMKSRPLKKSEEEEESSTQLCNGQAFERQTFFTKRNWWGVTFIPSLLGIRKKWKQTKFRGKAGAVAGKKPKK